MPAVVGKKAPSFRLKDQNGKLVSLKDFAGNRLILYFYPRAFTPGCTTQACDFRDSKRTLQRAGFSVAGVSPDPVEKLADFRKEYKLSFPLLSDPDHKAAAAYGAWGKKMNYGREYEGLIRSAFVIDPAGKVERVYTNVRAKGHVAKITRDLLEADD